MKEKALFDFCLLIPCYNNTEGLIKSLRSVRYSGGPFFIVIVDDGSHYPVDQAVLEHAIAHPLSMTVLRSPQNEGITKALNRGLYWIIEQLDTNYIARLDCGDICLPERFDEQIKYLYAHPSIALLGTWCRFESADKKDHYLYKTPVSHESIKRAMYLRNVFIHPTVIFSKPAVEHAGLYPLNHELAEDYALFWTIMNRQPVSVIPKVLVICEVNKTGISYSHKSKQLAARWKVVKKMGRNPLLKIISISRLLLLYLIPKPLVLWLKGFKS